MPKEVEQQPNTPEYYFGKDWFEVTEWSKDLWAIREPKHAQDVISYYLQGKDEDILEDILIDSGMGLSNIREVLPPNRNIKVLLTHTHWNHMGGVREFSDVYVFHQPWETNRLSTGWKAGEMPGFEPENFTVDVPASFSPSKFFLPGISKFERLTDGQEITLGGHNVLVIHTPGHTPGSTTFYIAEKGYLFTGNTIYPGPLYLHMAESDFEDYLKSLEKLDRIIGEQVKDVFPAHNAIHLTPEEYSKYILAGQGKIEPESIIDGEDEFNPYTQYKWPEFSFLLPRGARLSSSR